MEIPPSDYKPKNTEGGIGPFLAIVIIVAVLAAGGIYFLVTKEMQRQAAPTQTQANS